LSNILIKAEKGKIRLSATDLEVAITSQTIGKIDEDGELTVPARLLVDFVSNNSDESIEFTTKDNNSLALKSAHFKANIPGISAEEFPTVPHMPSDNLYKVKTADLVDGVKKVSIAPANDETRPVLAGIFFQFTGKMLTLASTDSYRLAEKKIELEEGTDDKKFIVPNRTMVEVLRLMTSDQNDYISLTFTENQIAFKIGETEVVSRLIEGVFPNYQQIIPSSSKIKVSANYSEFTSAVKMAALFAKNAANNISIETKDSKLIVSSIASQAGEAESNIAAEVVGGSVKVAFNARYVLDVLSVLSTDNIIIELNDEASAGLIRTEKDKGFMYIVMPLRIGE